MANVIFKTGNESALPSAKVQGQVLFAIDNEGVGSIYFDKDNDTRIKMTAHSDTATKWSAATTLYVALDTASKNVSIQGGEQSAVAIGIDGTLDTGHGGTGNTSFAAGKLIYSESATKLSSADKFDVDATNGKLTITTASGKSGEFTASRTNGPSLWMGVGTGNVNHGLYSVTLGKWMVYADATSVHLNGNSDTATKWASPTTLYVALGTASKTASIQGNESSDVVIGIDGTLGVAHGGTGKTTGNAAINYFLNELTTGSSTPGDNDYYISQYVGGGTTTTTYHRRPMSALWAYIKSKMTTTDGDYAGNAATSTKWSSPTTVYVGLGTASKITSIQGGEQNDVVLGVDGVLGVANGGTGKSGAVGSNIRPVYLASTGITAVNVYESGKNWSIVPVVASDGVMEIGKYIDFHFTDNGTSDYDARISGYSETGRSGLILSGSTKGTFIGNLTGNADTATKWASPSYLITKLDSTSDVSIQGNDGSTALEIGVTGILPVANGGTGVSVAKGSATQPVYLSSDGIAATTYSLSSTVDAGTENRIAWYKGANEIAAATTHYISDSKIHIGGTTEPTETFAVNGTAYLSGKTYYQDNVYFGTVSNTVSDFYIDNEGQAAFLSLAGIVKTGTGSDGNIFVAYPKGGQYISTSGSIAGQIQITLPVSWTNTMMRMTVSIYNYSTGTSVDYFVGGYNYSGGPSWSNTFAYAIGAANSPFVNLPVRFCHNGSKCVITIGETNTSWSYPKVSIHDVHLGHTANWASWNSGWTVTIGTSQPTVKGSNAAAGTITNPFIATAHTDSANKMYLVGVESNPTNTNDKRTLHYTKSTVYVTNGTVTATTFEGALSGNADTATQWIAPTTLYVQLNKADKTVSIQGSEQNAVAVGVDGILPVANGGTGQSNLDNVTVGTAKKVSNSLTITQGSTGSTSYNGSTAKTVAVDKILTQAEYDALGNATHSDNITYYISDGGTTTEYLSVTGGTISGGLNITGALGVTGPTTLTTLTTTSKAKFGDYLELWSDNEGGNISLKASSDINNLYQFDRYSANNLRLYSSTNGGESATHVWYWQNNGTFQSEYIGVNGSNTNYRLYVAGATRVTSNFHMEGAMNLIKTNVVKGTAPASTVYWNISCNDSEGTATANRLGLFETYISTDNVAGCYIRAYNPVNASTGSATLGVYYPQNGTAYTYSTARLSVGGTNTSYMLYVNGTGYFNNLLYQKSSGITVTFGAQNSSWVHIYNDSSKPFVFNNTVCTTSGNLGSTSYPWGTIYTNNWFRSIGNSGWYSETYGGGWYMTDTTWIRSYGGKSLYCGTATIRTDGPMECRTLWANKGSGERQIGVTYNGGNLYFWGNANSGTAGIYDSNAGYVAQRSGSTYLLKHKGNYTVRSGDNKLDYISDVTGSKYFHFGSSTGAWGVTCWASDIRLKKNISITEVIALDYIDAISHKQFDWKKDNSHEQLGYIAQEIKEIIPNSVIEIDQTGTENIIKENYEVEILQGPNESLEDYELRISSIEPLEDQLKRIEDLPETMLQINENAIIPYITKAIQELHEIIQSQQEEINQLKEALNN